MGYSIELNMLPKKACDELTEYYEFLLNKYSQRAVLQLRKAETMGFIKSYECNLFAYNA